MNYIRWYAILILAIAAVVGGVIGALIQLGISAYRNQKPTINRRIDILPKFEPLVGTLCSDKCLLITDGKQEYNYTSLQQVEIQLSNKSKQNFDKFKFGINLSADDVVIYIVYLSPDRAHQIEQLTPLSLAEPKSQVDFVLQPFNKGDSYSLRLLVKTSEGKKAPGNIEVTSPEAVRFIELPTVTEVVEKAARNASIFIGPFEISLNK